MDGNDENQRKRNRKKKIVPWKGKAATSKIFIKKKKLERRTYKTIGILSKRTLKKTTEKRERERVNI